MVFSKPVFQLWPEVPDKTLYWPSSAVSQSADGVALNLFAQFPNHINILWLRVALSEPPHHCVHPVNTLSAGGALTTCLVLVEHCKPCNCLNHICLLVHDNDRRCPETCLLCHQVVKVHQNFVTNRLGDEGSGAASRDDTEQVVPAADHSAAVALDQLLQGDAHLLPSCRWSEPRRQYRRWSQWWDSRRHRRQRGMGASGGACPAYPPGSRSRRSPPRRCRRQHHGAQRGRSHSQSHRRWLQGSQRRRPP